MLIAKQNRKALFTKLPSNSIAIIWGNKLQYRSHDVEYVFRQNSNFYYLTAFEEPNAVAVFIKTLYNEEQFILFSQALNIDQAIWTGSIIGQKLAVELYGADLAYSIDQIDDILPELLVHKEILYYPMLQMAAIETNLLKWRNISQKITKAKNNYFFPNKSQDLHAVLYELRLIKSPLELENMRYVAQISAKAHEHVIRYVANNSNLTERHIQAEFYNYCLKHGCTDMAYPPIVAAGTNACILHYTKNSARLKQSDLLLIDAGAEYNYYAADITRTFPINGKFSAKQRDLYQLVLQAQKAAINTIKPKLLWSNLQQTIVLFIVQGLVDLKLLSGNIYDLISNQAYKKFYMHGSGHFLGMDVHDPSSYKINNEYRQLLPGMVLTIEPGIYIQEEGIGIRIEDDILVTELGYEVLTKDAIKDVDDIEYLMKNK